MSKRVAVIGLGIQGQNHLSALSKDERLRIVAVCDANEELAKRIAQTYNCEAYVDY